MTLQLATLDIETATPAEVIAWAAAVTATGDWPVIPLAGADGTLYADPQPDGCEFQLINQQGCYGCLTHQPDGSWIASQWGRRQSYPTAQAAATVLSAGVPI